MTSTLRHPLSWDNTRTLRNTPHSLLNNEHIHSGNKLVRNRENRPNVTLTKDTALTQNSTPDIRAHLANVYTTLAATILAGAVGSIVSLLYGIGGRLSFFIGLGLLIWLSLTPRHEVNKRVAILLGFGFMEGISIGPLLDAVLEIDPQYLSIQ